MNLQGATLQGGKYGALSPKDYSGLAAWWRATDGVEFYNGNYVHKWKDLSGNGRDFIAYNPNTSTIAENAGTLGNTVNGVGILCSTTNIYVCLEDTTFKKILYEGSPITLIIIYRIIIYQSNTGFPFLFAGQNISSAGRFVVGSPNNGQQIIRTYNSGSNSIADNITGVFFSEPGGHILSVLDYGYNSDSPLLHRRSYIDGNLKSEKKFTSPPSALTDTTPLTLQGGASANAIYEIILYDNTGKTKAQIDYEHNKLYNEYILKRYPNLFL
jgi:hypothetical protein